MVGTDQLRDYISHLAWERWGIPPPPKSWRFLGGKDHLCNSSFCHHLKLDCLITFLILIRSFWSWYNDFYISTSLQNFSNSLTCRSLVSSFSASELLVLWNWFLSVWRSEHALSAPLRSLLLFYIDKRRAQNFIFLSFFVVCAINSKANRKKAAKCLPWLIALERMIRLRRQYCHFFDSQLDKNSWVVKIETQIKSFFFFFFLCTHTERGILQLTSLSWDTVIISHLILSTPIGLWVFWF